MTNVLIGIALDALKAAIAVLVPYLLMQVIGAIQDSRARAYALTVVQAAQQALPSNDARYDYAAAAVARRFPFLRQADISAFIEAAVHVLKTAPLDPIPPVAVPASAVEVSGDEDDENDRA